MRGWLYLFRPLILVLLTLQVSSASALPSGVHLSLCIGDNGQIELSPDTCAGEPTQSHQRSETILLDQAHHDGCLDIALACSSAEELSPTGPNVRSAGGKYSRDNTSPAPANYPYSSPQLFTQFSSLTSRPLNDWDFPPSHLVAIRSIVLLI